MGGQNDGADRKTGRRTGMTGTQILPSGNLGALFLGGGQLSSKWHLRSLQLSVAGFLVLEAFPVLATEAGLCWVGSRPGRWPFS